MLNLAVLSIAAAILFILIAYLCGWIYWTWPRAQHRRAIKSNVQAQVEAQRLFSDSDKIVLISRQLDEVDFSKVPKWQRDAFVEKVKAFINS